MPGHAKIVSVITAPVSTAPNCRPTSVTTGIRLLRNAWRSDRARARRAAGARGLHVRLAQLFEQRGPRHARQDRRQRGAQRDRRQHEMRRRAAARHRQPAELDGKDDRQQRPEPEVRNRHAGQRERHRARDRSAVPRQTAATMPSGIATSDAPPASRPRRARPSPACARGSASVTGWPVRSDVPRSPRTSAARGTCRTARAAADRGRGACAARRRRPAAPPRRASPAPDRRE